MVHSPLFHDIAMKRKEAQAIGSILDDILRENNLDIGLDAARARQAWFDSMGEAVDKCTISVHFDKGTLHVRLSSAVLRNELFINRRQLIERLNAKIGRPIIENIYLK